MTEHKLTDEEIIKDLQRACKWFEDHGKNTNRAIVGICERAVDLINRQKAEIERLPRIGDKVYEVGAEDGKVFVEELTVTEVATKRIFCSAHVPPRDDIDNEIPLAEIGVSVFLSREAAEAAGKRMKGGEEK